MVDLNWIAEKLIAQEAQKRRKIKAIPMAILGFNIKMEFNDLPIEVELSVTTKQELIEEIDFLYSMGLTKPKKFFKQEIDIIDQQAKVVAVTLSTKKTNAGKPMYEVVVITEAGDKHTVLKLIQHEFRADDMVWLFKNEKGYLDVKLDFPEGTDVHPF